MAEARSMKEWDQTSLLAAVLASQNRARGSAPIKPDDFHPHRRRRGGIDFSELKRMVQSMGAKKKGRT